MKVRFATLAGAFVMLAQPVLAQGIGGNEIIVTAMRREADGFDANIPAVGVTRFADFALQEVTITGDTRDPSQRADEIYAMLAAALAMAPKAGVVLASGTQTVEALTQDNYRKLTLQRDNRPDSQRVSFLVKVPVRDGGGAQDAERRVAAFVKAVKPVGRALMEPHDDLTLSVVAPDQYRPAIADAIAADARAMAARLGPDYGVEIEGLNRPVEWARAGLGQVLLYIPYKLTVVPRR